MTRETLAAHNGGGETSKLEAIGLMRRGTGQGRAVVHMSVRLPDGSVTVVETTWRLMRLALKALEGTPIASEET